MVSRVIGVVAMFAISACAGLSPEETGRRERAKGVALSYMARHRVPLPQRYRLTVAYYRLEPQSALQFPTYSVEVHSADDRFVYAVSIDPRSWKAVSFLNNSGIPMPWMYDEPRYETL